MSEDAYVPSAPRPVGERPYNASNPQDIVNAQELDKYRHDRDLEDLTVVLNSPTGRAVLWRVFGLFHLNAVSDCLDHPDLAAMHALHRAGNNLKRTIESVDPDIYHRMAMEAGQKERGIEMAFRTKRESAKATAPPA